MPPCTWWVATPERAREARAAVEAAGPGHVHVDLVDMADPEAVAAFGSRLCERYDRLDSLVHNAGALTRSYRSTPAGVELTVATQVLGPYVLTAALAPLLLRTSSSTTIVTVSSGGMYTKRFDLEHLEMGPDAYDGVTAYARAKRAQVVLADAWAHRFDPAGVASFAMHPGWVDTPGLQAGLPALPEAFSGSAPQPRGGCRHRRLARSRRAGGRGACRSSAAAHVRTLPRPAYPVGSPVPGSAAEPPR